MRTPRSPWPGGCCADVVGCWRRGVPAADGGAGPAGDAGRQMAVTPAAAVHGRALSNYNGSPQHIALVLIVVNYTASTMSGAGAVRCSIAIRFYEFLYHCTSLHGAI